MQERFAQWWMNAVMVLLTAFCVYPFLLLVSASFTDDGYILRDGYNIIPGLFSLDAYQYLWDDASNIVRAYGITILVTIIGTVVGLAIISMLAYTLSRKDMPYRNLMAFYVFFTMLFNGGLVPTYLLYTNFFDVKNTIWGLIIPVLLVNAFYVIIMRTFFATTIPFAVIEAALIDGAGEFKIFVKIILPLSVPVLATVGLFQTIHYWNDWFNGLIYITNSKYYSLQNLLNRILLDIQFLRSSTDNVGGEISARMPMQSMRMAMAVIGVFPILIAYPFFQKYFVKGITIGAVKG